MAKKLVLGLMFIVVGWMLLGPAGVWDAKAEEAPSTPPATRPGTDQTASPSTQPATAPSADDVAAKLLGQMEARPVVPDRLESIGGVTPATGVNAEVLGVAPGGSPPRLHREGQFIVSRKGRLVRTPHSAQAMFVFEADSEQAPEPPMILVPCQMLESIEDLVHERGDKLVFILSGQVLMYRGANYLLPTMMKLAVDRGNLEN